MALSWPIEREGQPSPGPLLVEPIKTVQYLLSQHSGATVVADGIFGPKTATAVRAFQSGHSLLVDGIVGNLTWPALIVEVYEGSHGEAVKGVQSQFEARAGEPGKGLAVDGIFGPKTDDAVRAFQTADSLTVDGIVGLNTWNALVNGALAG